MSNFLNDRHNLYCGWVLGQFAKHKARVTPMVDGDGNYLPKIAFEVGPETIVLDIPEPDEDWSLT